MGFSLPFSKKEITKEHYFGLYFTHENAVGFVFEIIDGQASILAKEMCKYSDGWENILEDIDKLISILESETDVHLEQSIFFIHSYMVDAETHDIKNPYKDIIKNIAKQLELKPLGYIEAHEAVKDHLQNKGNSPLNMVQIELDSMHVGVYVYKGGKLILSETLPRTSDLIDDVTQLMAQVHSHTLLPSKMIVYGMIKIDDKVEQLIHHKWDTDLFIQPPRVEILKGEELYASLGSIFAQQMGAVDIVEDSGEPEPVMIKEEIPQEETFGFVMGKDITQEPNIEPPEEEVMQSTAKTTPIPQKPRMILPSMSFKNPLAGFKGINMKGMGHAMKSFSMPKFNIMWMLLVVLVVGGFFAFEYFLHKAQIVVYMPSDTVEKTVDLTLPVGESSGSVSIMSHAFSSDFSEQKETTGKRDIGEKAKGEVNILNFDTAEKSFPAGTKLEVGGLSFVTDGAVRVASASSVTTGGAKQAGKARISATASTIGPESNIASGKQLKIAGLSDALYVAVAETAFRGGTKKQIRTVARADLDSLKETLTSKAETESIKKVEPQIQSGHELIKELTVVKLNTIDYSKEISEEADSVDATASTETTYYTVQKQQMQKQLTEELRTDAPAGFQLDPQKVTFTVETAKMTASSSEAELTIEAQAVAVKQAQPDAIVEQISGKFVSDLDGILTKSFDAKDFEMKEVNPPFVTLWTPLFKKNITVSISSK